MPRGDLANITKETLAPIWGRHDIPIRVMADALGVSRQAVSQRARALGLPSREKVRIKLSRDDEFRRLWLAGVSTKDIAAHFGYRSHSCITVRRRGLGLPPRTRSKGGGRCGWAETITLTEFREVELARKMKEAAACV